MTQVCWCFPAKAVTAVSLQNYSEAEDSCWTGTKWIVQLGMDFRPNPILYSFRYPSHFLCGTCLFLPLDVLMLLVRRKLQWAKGATCACQPEPSDSVCQSNSDKYPDWDNQNLSRDLFVVLLNFNDNWMSMLITQAVSFSSPVYSISKHCFFRVWYI